MGSGSSKLYRREDLHYAPTVYPAAVESALSDTDIAQHQKLLDHADAALAARFEALTLDDYRRHFRAAPDKFDCFDKNCQDMALLFTAELAREQLLEWLHGADAALAWLVRVRSIAIGTRVDVDWRGQVHFDDAFAAARRTELHERWRASRLFHWQRDSANGDAVWNEVRAQLADQAEAAGTKPRDAPIEIVAQAPLDAVERLATSRDSLTSSAASTSSHRIAWVIKTTSHICCGNFANPATLKWRCEHQLATLTDAVASVSLRAEHADGDKPHDALVYRAGCHIPLGGALSAPTRLLFVRKQPDSVALLVPFPRQRFHGASTDEKAALASELLRTMSGVVKSALAVGAEILVLPSAAATQTAEEAYTYGNLWGRVLRPTRRHFRRIVVAAAPAKPGEKLDDTVFKALTDGLRTSTTQDAPGLERKLSSAGVEGRATRSASALPAVKKGDDGDDNGGDDSGGAAAPAASKEPTSDQVRALLEQTASEMEEEKRLAELKALEDAERARAAEEAARAEREAAERAERAKAARTRFREQLRAAMDAHQKKHFGRAVDLYADGLEALGEAYSLETDPEQKEDLRLQFDRYIRVAESAKESKKKQEQDMEPR